ncbi:uncharacterized protein LOC132616102 isoform X6 [Lycium barbarum]|uniref:uncharacterized protein LOC132616102 isoform X6 n=1 Tax=Lycium barbarum TaxID=112863 RepID=UPI00293E05B5|nr:uncharacterized protein LOC132616102 isoform X6 [Lycium barbarum]
MGGGGDHKEKTTTMVLKVDLQCPCCYKKTKKILCKIPRGKTIKSIEIKEPAKPKQPEKPKKGEEKPPPDKLVDSTDTKGPEISGVVNKPKDDPTAAMVATPWMSEPMMMMPPVQGYPQAAHGCGCGQSYYTGGPCYQYYGTPTPPQPAPYYGNYSYGYGPGPGPSSYGKGCYVNNDYFNDENAQGCTIM